MKEGIQMKRLKDVMKDEQGLTLVELLAVVVILAVILGIGAVGIGTVIQNAREDGQVAAIQQVMAAAQVYDAQNATDETKAWVTDAPVDAQKLITDGLLKAVTFADSAKIIVTKDANGVLSIAVADDALLAGKKKNKAHTVNDKQISSLKRADFKFAE